MTEGRTTSAGSLESQMEFRLGRLRFLEERGINPFPAEPPLRTAANSVIREQASDFILKGEPVDSVGRVQSLRRHKGKTFVTIDDGSGELDKTRGDIQLLVTEDTNPELYEILIKGIDEGDFLHAAGTLSRTKTGELTINVTGFDILAKAIRPPLNKRQGSEISPDIARGQRYRELMSSPEARERFRTRSRIVQIMREIFIKLGNLEVETPMMDTTYGGASARTFTTQHNALNQPMFLRISNELYLKRLIVGMLNDGAGGVFEFSRDFRNEGMDATHHPEFTQVELYMPYKDYNFMMDMTEQLYKEILNHIHGKLQIEFQGNVINFENWRKVRIFDGLKDVLNIDPRTISDEDLNSLVQTYGIDPNIGRGFKLLELFEEAVIPQYGPDPIFVLDYPVETSPLTKIHRSEPDVVERFELFVNGMELANCYTELNDSRDQRQRFIEETKRRLAGDAEAQPEDEDFITAMEYGLPPVGGIGLSIDRLVMLLTNRPHIQDVILFPHRRK